MGIDVTVKNGVLNSYNFCQIKKIVFGNTVYETINRCSKGDSNELEEMDCDSNAACSDHMAVRF